MAWPRRLSCPSLLNSAGFRQLRSTASHAPSQLATLATKARDVVVGVGDTSPFVAAEALASAESVDI
jgi:hypothetical protein